jgi:hypothetical protein
VAISDHPIDGSLANWADIESECEWKALLLGNGLSSRVWESFKYPFLYDKAGRGDVPGTLTREDRNLFEALDTPNFERVLADVAAAIRVAEALGYDAEPFYNRYRSIQLALGSAMRAVHVNRDGVPLPVRQAIGKVLQEHEFIFSTSYDLIVYWGMGAVDFDGLCDCFWGEAFSFDPEEPDPPAHLSPVYFLHGALHLVVMGSGQTRKLTRNLYSILDQFGNPVDGDRQARPLLVTEGSAQHKVQAIEGNDYLAHALGKLGECYLPLVVFGSSLAEQDQHLVEAINREPDRGVAVSIHSEGKRSREIRAEKANLRGILDAKPLLFFDADTHPLGRATASPAP